MSDQLLDILKYPLQSPGAATLPDSHIRPLPRVRRASGYRLGVQRMRARRTARDQAIGRRSLLYAARMTRIPSLKCRARQTARDA